MQTYVGFLRGINVGGHHKLPMADLRTELKELGFSQITTLLNSGNVIFQSDRSDPEKLIENHLTNVFNFPVPTILRKADTILALAEENPFAEVTITKDIRLYVSFLQKEIDTDIDLPWVSDDESYRILLKKERTIVSVLDLSMSKTIAAMKELEQFFGKNITTRNWKTIERVVTKLNKQYDNNKKT